MKYGLFLTYIFLCIDLPGKIVHLGESLNKNIDNYKEISSFLKYKYIK